MLKTMGVNQKLPTFVLLIHLIMQLAETYSHELELTMGVEKPEKIFEKVQENLKTDENSSLKTIFIIEAAPNVIEDILSNLTKETSGKNITKMTENGSNILRNKREDKELTFLSESFENFDPIRFLGNYELQKINATKTENGANRALNNPNKSKLSKKAVPLVSNRQSTFSDKKIETTPLHQNKSRGQNRRQRNHARNVNLLTRGMNQHFIPLQTQVPQTTTFSSTPQVENFPATKFQRRSFDVAPEDISGRVSKRNSGFGTRLPFPTLPYSSFTNRPPVVTNPGIYQDSTFNLQNYHFPPTHHANILDQNLSPTKTQNYDVIQPGYSTRKPVFELLSKYDKIPRPFAMKQNSETNVLIEHLGTRRDPIYQGSQYNVPATLSPNNFHTTNFPSKVHHHLEKAYSDLTLKRPPPPTPERNHNDYNSFVQRTLTPQLPYVTYPNLVNNYSGPTRPPYQEYDYNSNNYDYQQVPRKPQQEKKSSKPEGYLNNQFISYNPNNDGDKKYTESKNLQSVSVINPYKVIEAPEEEFRAHETATVGQKNGPKFELKYSVPTKNYEVTERSFNDFSPTTLYPFKTVAEQSIKPNSEAYKMYPSNEAKESDHELNSHRGEYKEDESEEKKSDINYETEDEYNFGEKNSDNDAEIEKVTDSNREPTETKLTAGSEVAKVIVLNQEKEGSDHEQKDHKKPKKDELFEEGGGGEHGQEHHEEESESGEKFYDSKHEHEKSEKGHHDKEDHTHDYNEEEGHKTDSEDKGEYEKLYHKEKEGDKEATFDEKGEHNKGHSTKGQHVVHKNDEFEKETEFFDEFIEEDGDEKDGAYHHEHHSEKGGNYKSGHHLAELGEEKHGKGGQFAKGHNHHEDEGHKQDEAHDQYHQNEKKYGNKGEHSDSKTWQHEKSK